MRVGQTIQLEIEGLGPIGGSVVRLDDKYCGLRLDLREDEIESLKVFVDQLRDAA